MVIRTATSWRVNGVTTMTLRRELRDRPCSVTLGRRWLSAGSASGRALHMHLQAGSVLGQPALAPAERDHLVPPGHPAGGRRAWLGGGAEGRDVEEDGVGVSEPAQTG